jgi:hypothetical protein
MANNLFISYDLNSPNQNYKAIFEEIKLLGDWALVQKSVWYVNSVFNAEEVAEKLKSKLNSNDTLLIVDSVNNEAYWFNMSDEVAKHIVNSWSK